VSQSQARKRAAEAQAAAAPKSIGRDRLTNGFDGEDYTTDL